MQRPSEPAEPARVDPGAPTAPAAETDVGGEPRLWRRLALPRWLGSQTRAWGQRGWRAVVIELALLALGVWAALHLVYLTTYGSRVPNRDVIEYQHYALQFWSLPPHLPVEYPPLSILSFFLTLLPPGGDPQVIFAFWMGVLFLAGYLWFLRYADRRRALTYALYLLVGTASTVFARFDLVPALATLLALAAAQRRRFAWAYVLLALGILLKLYPAFLIPLVAIEQWRTLQRTPDGAQTSQPVPPARSGTDRAAGRKRAKMPTASLLTWLSQRLARLDRAALWTVARGVGLCVLVVDLGFANAALISPSDVLSGFGYAGTRPLQIESTPASLLWIGSWFGLPARAVYTFQSLNLVGPLDHVLEPLSALALAAGCLLVYWRQLRGRLNVGRAFVACLCVILVTNKIFSPQYLIWVLPLAAYVAGFDLLWLVVGILTTLIYPFLYFAHPHILLVARDWRFLPLIALRNGLLVIVTVRAVWGRGRWAKRLWGRISVQGQIQRADQADHVEQLGEPDQPDRQGQVPVRVSPT